MNRIFSAMLAIVITIGTILCTAAAPTFAQTRSVNDPPEVGIDQKLDHQVPLDLTFHDSAGRPVALKDLIHDRPVILNLVYYRCPMLCTEVLNGLVRTLRAVPMSAGREFDIITVSIDPRETHDLAASKKSAYVGRYDRAGADEGWHFLTGDAENVRRLADAVGFRYEYQPDSDQFAHASGIMVVTPKGRLARYFYGIDYAPRDVRLALVEAADHRIGSPVDQLLLLCLHYDPLTGKYGLAIMNIIRFTAVLTVLALTTFIVRMIRNERTARTRPTTTPRPTRPEANLN
jgi:protein SCO1/2